MQWENRERELRFITPRAFFLPGWFPYIHFWLSARPFDYPKKPFNNFHRVFGELEQIFERCQQRFQIICKLSFSPPFFPSPSLPGPERPPHSLPGGVEKHCFCFWVYNQSFEQHAASSQTVATTNPWEGEGRVLGKQQQRIWGFRRWSLKENVLRWAGVLAESLRRIMRTNSEVEREPEDRNEIRRENVRDSYGE